MELGFRVVRKVARIGPPPLSTTRTGETRRTEVPDQSLVRISPPGGAYREAQTVRISTMNRPGSIYYTLDGTSPTDLSPVYSTPISVRETTIRRALFVGSFRKTASRDFVIDPAASRLDLSANALRVQDATGDDVRDGPIQWKLSQGVVAQWSNIYQGSKADTADVRRDGTLRFYSEPPPPHDEVYFEFKSDDDDAVGMAFRVQNDQHYYLYAMGQDRRDHVLALIDGDEYRVLAKAVRGYERFRWHQVRIQQEGPKLTVYFNGIKNLEAIDGSLSAGTVGLYCWGAKGAHFRNIIVRRLPSAGN